MSRDGQDNNFDCEQLSIYSSTIEPLDGELGATCTAFRRSPMGSYNVPLGEKPLTSLGDCKPAPSDYSPKIDLTKHCAPKYSIAGPWRSKKCNYNSSPADYMTSQSMIWSDKKVALKGKGKMRVHDSHLSDSQGPARYKVDNFATTKAGRRSHIGARVAVCPGPPNKLVQPVDSHGVNNPGPNYRPNSSYWGRGPKKSFGSSRRESHGEGPGPAEYTVNDLKDPKLEKAGFKHSFGIRLPSPLQWRLSINKGSPAPNTYNLGTTIGEDVAKSMSGRQRVVKRDFVPAPNMYVLPDEMQQDNRSCQMTYRTFEPNQGPHPSPAHYTINKVSLRNSPRYTIRHRTRPGFPDILNYKEQDTSMVNPGPGEYDRIKRFTDNDQPSYSMRKRARSAKNDVPGPNHYKLAMPHPPHAKKAPSFSMSKRFDPPDSKVSPGPAAYSVKPTKSGPCYSMTKRPESKKKMVTPAANAYHLKLGQDVRGHNTGPKVTLKSRASPFVYSGIKTEGAKLLEPTTS